MSLHHPTDIELIKTLAASIWERRDIWPSVERWLKNFSDPSLPSSEQEEHALFLLTKFMFFGSREIRELLKSLYRDLYKYFIIEKIRIDNRDTLDGTIIEPLFEIEQKKTKFLGIGNPSESGSHLLYYFRQENRLNKDLFINTHDIFSTFWTEGTKSLLDPQVTRYIFLDDICGSGSQVLKYSNDFLKPIKEIDPQIQIDYLVLFGSTEKLAEIEHDTLFDRARAVMEYDASFRCFSPESRFFHTDRATIKKEFAEQVARLYGNKLWPLHPLGWKDGQLLFGFAHNTPDNTLPIFWYDELVNSIGWEPVFRRYPKFENN